ncbi:hypothetical protein ADUPG1_006941 [Aduncisulcus paluster]|uniref:Uncharacterized protein n=1 Tax=Aduncisulcus paluster TaxID=2918883 RepID=A0ABQ5KN02_9EUKA|nr:hypothetical protein ADUPG1_006941 [Aduncisulcus paluster]
MSVEAVDDPNWKELFSFLFFGKKKRQRHRIQFVDTLRGMLVLIYGLISCFPPSRLRDTQISEEGLITSESNMFFYLLANHSYATISWSQDTSLPYEKNYVSTWTGDATLIDYGLAMYIFISGFILKYSLDQALDFCKTGGQRVFVWIYTIIRNLCIMAIDWGIEPLAFHNNMAFLVTDKRYTDGRIEEDIKVPMWGPLGASCCSSLTHLLFIAIFPRFNKKDSKKRRLVLSSIFILVGFSHMLLSEGLFISSPGYIASLDLIPSYAALLQGFLTYGAMGVISGGISGIILTLYESDDDQFVLDSPSDISDDKIAVLSSPPESSANNITQSLKEVKQTLIESARTGASSLAKMKLRDGVFYEEEDPLILNKDTLHDHGEEEEMDHSGSDQNASSSSYVDADAVCDDYSLSLNLPFSSMSLKSFEAKITNANPGAVAFGFAIFLFILGFALSFTNSWMINATLASASFCFIASSFCCFILSILINFEMISKEKGSKSKSEAAKYNPNGSNGLLQVLGRNTLLISYFALNVQAAVVVFSGGNNGLLTLYDYSIGLSIFIFPVMLILPVILDSHNILFGTWGGFIVWVVLGSIIGGFAYVFMDDFTYWV